MDIVGLHELIDQWAEKQREEQPDRADTPNTHPVTEQAPAPTRVLPEGKRAVRTKSSGDKVYLLDDVKKTRQHIATPEILKSLGFEMGDVGEVDDAEMIRYQNAPAINRLDATA